MTTKSEQPEPSSGIEDAPPALSSSGAVGSTPAYTKLPAELLLGIKKHLTDEELLTVALADPPLVSTFFDEEVAGAFKYVKTSLTDIKSLVCLLKDPSQGQRVRNAIEHLQIVPTNLTAKEARSLGLQDSNDGWDDGEAAKLACRKYLKRVQAAIGGLERLESYCQSGSAQEPFPNLKTVSFGPDTLLDPQASERERDPPWYRPELLDAAGFFDFDGATEKKSDHLDADTDTASLQPKAGEVPSAWIDRIQYSSSKVIRSIIDSLPTGTTVIHMPTPRMSDMDSPASHQAGRRPRHVDAYFASGSEIPLGIGWDSFTPEMETPTVTLHSIGKLPPEIQAQLCKQLTRPETRRLLLQEGLRMDIYNSDVNHLIKYHLKESSSGGLAEWGSKQASAGRESIGTEDTLLGRLKGLASQVLTAVHRSISTAVIDPLIQRLETCLPNPDSDYPGPSTLQSLADRPAASLRGVSTSDEPYLRWEPMPTWKQDEATILRDLKFALGPTREEHWNGQKIPYRLEYREIDPYDRSMPTSPLGIANPELHTSIGLSTNPWWPSDDDKNPTS